MHKKRGRDQFYDFYEVWLIRINVQFDNLTLQKKEVIDAKWVSKSDLEKCLKLINWFQHSNIFLIFFPNVIGI